MLLLVVGTQTIFPCSQSTIAVVALLLLILHARVGMIKIMLNTTHVSSNCVMTEFRMQGTVTAHWLCRLSFVTYQCLNVKSVHLIYFVIKLPLLQNSILARVNTPHVNNEKTVPTLNPKLAIFSSSTAAS